MPSSVIATMSYDEKRQTLTILYRRKPGAYRYHDVSRQEYMAFRSAPSKGTYLNQTFKAQHPRYELLRPSQVIHLVQKPEQELELEKHGKDDRRHHR
ncbi:MAG: KTSC domain-containing protein [Edaphobacter sp.]|uniref:KTSC domain-containing protein n=1 Tax=Edaphobacter sp. TaxID=1934404 RepID=UPI0023938DBC|nr:KTSC domain-containing protein [Edaphobacter sp.]MDE1178730.1 KTSC domain-containing protein [Edaphobacter sp.]